jgi:deoxyribose-phosphate aldolase
VTKQEILNRIDHTLLKAAASWEEIKTLCDEAVRFNAASACIPPAFVKSVNYEYGSKAGAASKNKIPNAGNAV